MFVGVHQPAELTWRLTAKERERGMDRSITRELWQRGKTKQIKSERSGGEKYENEVQICKACVYHPLASAGLNSFWQHSKDGGSTPIPTGLCLFTPWKYGLKSHYPHARDVRPPSPSLIPLHRERGATCAVYWSLKGGERRKKKQFRPVSIGLRGSLVKGQMERLRREDDNYSSSGRLRGPLLLRHTNEKNLKPDFLSITFTSVGEPHTHTRARPYVAFHSPNTHRSSGELSRLTRARFDFIPSLPSRLSLGPSHKQSPSSK